MSSRTVIKLICDLTLLNQQEEVPATDTLRYFDPETGELRETDLTADNFSQVSTELAALTSFLRKISRAVESAPKGRRSNKPAPVVGEQQASVQEMRVWLEEAGYVVNPRGRLPKALVQAFLDGRRAPVQEGIEIPPQPESPVAPVVEEAPAVEEMPVERDDPPLFFVETEYEKAHPERDYRGRKIAEMTDEERRDLLLPRMLKAMELLNKEQPEARIPNLHSRPNDILLMVALGMIKGEVESLEVTERGVDALKHAGRT